jgi:hypothetical protein
MINFKGDNGSNEARVFPSIRALFKQSKSPAIQAATDRVFHPITPGEKMGLGKVQFGAIEGTVEFETARKRKLLEQSRSFDFRTPHKQYECACDKGEPNQWIVQRSPKKLFPHRFALSSSVVPSVTKYCTRPRYKERYSRSREALCLRGTSCPLWLK